ncbi:MAG: hypothetical protein HW380_683 [Magnetococcales bacterium]|nr:hypothetical protein [Magnetococcales bacterium]
MNYERMTARDVELAMTSLAEKRGEIAAGLLQKVPADMLAAAMVQEVADGVKARDYDFLRGLDGVLCRVVELQGAACA